MRVRPLLLLAAASLTATVAVPMSTATAAGPAAGSGGRFIVTVADAYDSRSVAEDHRRKGVEVEYVYSHALNGFAGEMSDAELGELQRDRRVTRIERDGVVTATETTQTSATWGLDRIDQRDLTLSGTYGYTHAGKGVNAYIIDTGIRSTHGDLAPRVADVAFDAFGGDGEDCNGHGTHVAGTVGGSTYGVAKSVALHSVRVLDCAGSGTWSGVIAGVDWVTAKHLKPAVANMSLGGGANDAVDAAVANAVAAGVTMVVAAGNGNQGGKAQDACGYSPAREPTALTIGATDKTDTKTSWSNYGDCVDLFAPGYQITSTWHTADDATNTISGTSMAAPHVAGVAALYLEQDSTASPKTVGDAIDAATTKGIVTSSSTAKNHLLFSHVQKVVNAAPVAGFTVSCGGLACGFTSTSSDSDGTITAHSWDFGVQGSDTDTSTLENPSYEFPSAGTYDVVLTVTDDDSDTGTVTQAVTVTADTSGGGTEDGSGTVLTLSATAYKLKGFQHVDLAWSGGPATHVNVFRDDLQIGAGVANPGSDTDQTGKKGGGSYTYKVCEVDSNPDDGLSPPCDSVIVVF